MENTIMTGDRLFGFRLSYLMEDPKRGDIVIFKYPDNESINYIKRIIGLPGETVTIKDSKVYINNSATPLKEDSRFFICNRGTIINMEHAVDFDGTMFLLDDGSKIVVSRELCKPARQHFMNYLFQKEGF